jgi:hypothetical protein
MNVDDRDPAAAAVDEGAGAARRGGALAWPLTRGRLIAFALGLVTLAVIAVGLSVFARGWWEGSGGTYAPRRILAGAQISPRSSLFGDVLTAQVEVILDPRRYDPASVQLTPNFAPYVVNSQSRRVETGVGRATMIAFSYSIQCLTASCIPLMSTKTRSGDEARTVSFPEVKFSARERGGALVAETVHWPSIVVHSRLSASQIALATPEADPTPALPALRWRISPDLLGALALTLAVLLALTACWLAASVALQDSKLLIRRLRFPTHLTPVERAVLLAQHAASRGEREEERKALQRLAVELSLVGRGDLAGRARRLAWSEESPAPELVGALADEARANGAG